MFEIIDEIRSNPHKADRMTLRERVVVALGVVCFFFLLFLAVAWSTKAYAEEIPVHVLEQNGVVVRLMNTPCVDPVSIAQINPAFLHRFKAIDSMWPENGQIKRYAGCWVEMSKEETGAEEAFLLVFEDGAKGVVPKAEAVKKRGQTGV
jgi:hypothetical protein